MNTREVTLKKVSLTQEELTTLSNARDIIGDIIHFAGWKDLYVEDESAIANEHLTKTWWNVEDDVDVEYESAIANGHLRKAWCVLDDLCGYQEFTI